MEGGRVGNITLEWMEEMNLLAGNKTEPGAEEVRVGLTDDWLQHKRKHAHETTIQKSKSMDDAKPAPGSSTLTKMIVTELHNQKTIDSTYSQTIFSILTAIRCVSCLVRRQASPELFGISQTKPQADNSQMCEDLFANLLETAGSVFMLVAGRDAKVTMVNPNQHYIVGYTALDNPENVESSDAVGSLFAIYQRSPGSSELSGKHIVTAGYALYGSSTMLYLVLMPGHPLRGFVLDPVIGDFMLIDHKAIIPSPGSVYSIGEINVDRLDSATVEFIRRIQSVRVGRQYTLKFTASLVMDVHSIIKKGGILVVSSTNRKDRQKLLTLLTMSLPIAFILKEAGGLAMYGRKFVLEVIPESFQDQVPVVLGSVDDVAAYHDVLVLYRCLDQRHVDDN